MAKRFDEPQEATDHFYDHLNLDVSYMPAMWGTFTVGHLLGIDLDRVCRLYDLSIADVNAIGALRDGKQLRATDLAQRLHVSNGVLSVAARRQIGKAWLPGADCQRRRPARI
jgi:hypothetical protein